MSSLMDIRRFVVGYKKGGPRGPAKYQRDYPTILVGRDGNGNRDFTRFVAFQVETA